MVKNRRGMRVWNTLYLVNQSNYASTLFQTPWKNCEENKLKVENIGTLFNKLTLFGDRKYFVKYLESSSKRISRQEWECCMKLYTEVEIELKKDICMLCESMRVSNLVSVLMEKNGEAHSTLGVRKQQVF